MHHDKKQINRLMLVMACFLAACEQRSPALVSSDGNSPNASHPRTLADMNGWHGIQVTQAKSNGRTECSILFPPNFGLSKDEINLLTYIVSRNAAFRSKTDCWVTSNGIYQALDKLRQLAVEKNDSIAAHLLLYRGTTDMPFELDGEALESYTESYVVPVLEKFEKLDVVLDQASESIIAKSICINLQKYDDMKDPVFKKRIQVLVKRLNGKGMGRFAREIESCDLSRPPGQ